MDITVYPGKLTGSLNMIPSKSQVHRLLICAAFADEPTTLICPAVNEDIEATVDCLNALGAKVLRTEEGYTVTPISSTPKSAILNCRESGSTLRFMLPIAGCLGVDTTFKMAGRLSDRPLSPLWEEMERMGCKLIRADKDSLICRGKLHSGNYQIDGSVSSQFITGLLLALAIMPGENHLTITGQLQSAPYVKITEKALSLFGVDCEGYTFCNRKLRSPGTITAEGDWSNGAFFLGANALGSNIQVNGLAEDSPQGDKAVIEYYNKIETPITVFAQDIPDLVPILAVVSGAKQGATFHNISRLRLKESDRVAAVQEMVQAFGAEVIVTDEQMIVYPGQYHSCTINAHNDHRIAMAAAIGATVADGPVTIIGAECVKKSYPDFWFEFEKLGGKYEQYIR